MGLILFAMLDQTFEAITDELDDALWTQTDSSAIELLSPKGRLKAA
jgi:hypothetical protein